MAGATDLDVRRKLLLDLEVDKLVMLQKMFRIKKPWVSKVFN